MTKRHTPITSILAHYSVKPSKQIMYDKILVGMEKLRVGGTSEEIAAASGLKHDQVWKRLSEMEGLGLIFNTGITRLASSGRKAMVRQLVTLKPSTTVTLTNFIVTNTKEVIPNPQLDLFDLSPVTASWDSSIE